MNTSACSPSSHLGSLIGSFSDNVDFWYRRRPRQGRVHIAVREVRLEELADVIFHLYVVETKNPAHRDQLLNFLQDNNIDAKCHYPIAIHQQEGYPWGKEARIVGDIPNSERNAACCVSLPMFPELTEEEVDYVIAKVLEWEKSIA